MLEFNIYNGWTDPIDHVRYYQQMMVYWFSDDAIMCRMFSASLGYATLRWFIRLLVGQIDNLRELAEHFTATFITNSRVIKGPEALTNLKKEMENFT